ncbi:MAG: PilZ domain-containing protein [Kofleriaceae bacterium]|nr:PilZ domain-containing protein [Kofleriaceae bacterium]
MTNTPPPKNLGGEKRDHFRGRASPGNRVDLSYRRSDGSKTAAGENESKTVAINLGVGGVFLLSLTPEAVGSKLKLHLKVPSQTDQLRIDGEVCWIKSGEQGSAGMGIQFATLNTKALIALRNYFSQLG